MSRRVFTLAAMLCCLGLCLPAGVSAQLPIPSKWALNVGQSDFGKGPKMTSHTETFTLTKGSLMKGKKGQLSLEDVRVYEGGSTWTTLWSGPLNGTSRPMEEGMPGGLTAWNESDSSAKLVLPDGTVFRQVYKVAPDKKTMTMDVEWTDMQGNKGKQKLVYDRLE